VSAYLALRRTNPPGLLPAAFAWLTRWRLHTTFPHAGIVVDGVLFHATFAHGLTAEPFDARGWQLYPIECGADRVRDRFAENAGARYDWFSLLGFVLPWRVSVRRWLYCYEWAFLAMTGAAPGIRVTPEILLDLAHKQKGSPP
jgi:hypothetical protein